jgi:NADP-dependent 3-hydroxy acid dehydrogenase YdfG
MNARSASRRPASLRIAVLGATGGLGSAVVRAAVEAGCDVVAVARDAARLADLGRRLGNPAALTPLGGSVATEEDAARLATDLRGLRARLDAVVVALAPPFAGGRLLERDAAAVADSVALDLVPQFLAAKHLLPVLAARKRATTYAVLGCAAADYPWAGYGHVSLGAAARKMLVQVLREECKDAAIRIQLVQIDGQVCTHKNRSVACPAWASAESIGARIVELVAHADTQSAVVHLRAAPTPSVPQGERS